MNLKWKNDEFGYCYSLAASRGDDSTGRDPKTVATYLRIQSAAAFRDREYEISARLATAATAINCDARNNHVPDWDQARIVLDLRTPANGNATLDQQLDAIASAIGGRE